MFTDLFKRANTRNPSTGEWSKKLWYRHTIEYYSATRRNEVLIQATT